MSPKKKAEHAQEADVFERSQERLEAEESSRLAPFAQRSSGASRRHDIAGEGRLYRYRTEFQRDRDRVLHSPAFRRLGDVGTRLGGALEGRARTRLTQALETAQVGRTIARALGLNEDLVEAITLAGELGSPPFGEEGAAVLDALLRGRAPELGDAGRIDAGGFRVADASLRIADIGAALNLTDLVREGVFKRDAHAGEGPSTWSVPDWLVADGLAPKAACHFEGQTASLAARLVSVLGALDDALDRGWVDVDEVERLQAGREVRKRLGERYDREGSVEQRRAAQVRALTHLFVTSAVRESAERLERWTRATGIRTAGDMARRRGAAEPSTLALSPRTADLFAELERFVDREARQCAEAVCWRERSRHVMRELFVALHDQPLLVDDTVLRRHAETSETTFLRAVPTDEQPAELQRHYHGRGEWCGAVADSLCLLTDGEALRLHGALRP